MADTSVSNDFAIQSYFLFNTEGKDLIPAFENMTQLKVNQRDVFIYPIADFEDVSQASQKESWWNSFWTDGWSHITLGTVSTVLGIGILCLATGPVGWVTGVLAIAGGGIGAISGVAQLSATDPKTKQLYATIAEASLSLNNIPGLAVGVGSYVLTNNLNQSLLYANLAGIAAGGTSLIRNSLKAYGTLRLYNLNIGLNNSSWSTFTRNLNARLVGINPRGLEASHLVPQRVINKMVQRVPLALKRPIENLLNSPLFIHFMLDTEHALVDPYRWRFLRTAQKEILRVTNPLMSNLMDNYPKLGGLVGVYPNLSPTIKPVVNSLVITTDRVANYSSLDK